MFSAGGETRITSRVTGIFSIHDQHLILVVFEFALIDFGGAFNVTKAATMAETVWMERGMGSCSV